MPVTVYTTPPMREMTRIELSVRGGRVYAVNIIDGAIHSYQFCGGNYGAVDVHHLFHENKQELHDFIDAICNNLT